MRRLLLPLTVVAAATAMLVFLLPSAPAAANPMLEASVGPSFSISLRDQNHATVTHVDPGTYDIHVVVHGSDHNFHLKGPGVDEASPFQDTDVIWTVTFVDGTYHFQCDAHPLQMRGDFTAGTPPPPPAPPPPPPPNPGSGFAKGTTFKASVAGSAISLKDAAGKPVRKVKAGTRYTIKVADRSTSQNFHLAGKGVNKKTSVPKKAGATWKLKFKKGKTYSYRSDARRSMKGSFKAA
ncbi:MAG: hypothetical protein ACJ73L_12155 [Actinomycetes bacterium]